MRGMIIPQETMTEALITIKQDTKTDRRYNY